MKKEQVLISVFLIAILVLSSGSMVAFAKSNTHVVLPNGHDDTKDIQNAFNACGSTPGCTVQLVAGTYYIAQIAVYGFQGSFVGMGQGVTVIQALPNLPSPNPTYDTDTIPWWAALPTGASGTNPWPVLFTFLGGAFSISGMTITDTYSAPTLGWDYFGITTLSALAAFITVTSSPTSNKASATVDHMTFVGAAGDTQGYNSIGAIYYGGELLPPGWTNSIADEIPLTGAFSLTNSVFEGVNGPTLEFLSDSNAAICGNTVSNAGIAGNGVYYYPFQTVDISNTNVLFCRNQGTLTTDGAAVFVGQSFYKSGLLPSTVTITGNNFQVNQGANAVVVSDAGEADFGTPVTLSAVISGNVFQNIFPGGNAFYQSVVISYTTKSTIVSSNYISGGGSPGVYLNGGPGTVSGNTITGAYTGVWLDVASNAHVAGNVVKNSVEYGIALTSSNVAGSSTTTPSSNDFITGNFVHGSGAYDLYWDEATGSTNNHWCGNIYTTSSPSVLPSC